MVCRPQAFRSHASFLLAHRTPTAIALNQVGAVARQQPVLMVFEDAHWIDPTSRELLELTVDRARRPPVLLAITFALCKIEVTLPRVLGSRGFAAACKN